MMSEDEMMKAKIAPETRLERNSGKVTLKNACTWLAPRLRATDARVPSELTHFGHVPASQNGQTTTPKYTVHPTRTRSRSSRRLRANAASPPAVA
jgi:hypothetical protein